MTMRKLIVAVASLGIAGVVAAPGAAHGEHASCQGFGELISGAAQFAPGFGTIVSENARAGMIPEIVAGYHGAFCQPKP
jgi:hypothetical protein